MNPKNEKPRTDKSVKEASHWIAVDLNNNKIAEAETPEETIKKAEETKKEFLLEHVPVEGSIYFY